MILWLRRLRAAVEIVRFLGLGETLRRALSVYRSTGVGGLLRKSIDVADRSKLRENAPINSEGDLVRDRLDFQISLGHRQGPALPRRKNILILTETTLDQCWRYRVENKLKILSASGISSSGLRASDLHSGLTAVQFASAVIFYRMPMNDLFMIYHDEARRLGLPVIYDLDDPCFDPILLGTNPNLKEIAPFYLAGQLNEAKNYRLALEASDYLLSSTPFLADLMEKASNGKPSFVWRNAAESHALETSMAVFERESKTDSRLKIGYFSGSLAHEADFEIILPTLIHVLKTYPDIDLLIAGHAAERDELIPFSNRITRIAFSDYESYLAHIAKTDLVVIPLVDDEFNRCKSVVRFLDAAMLSVPVIASPVGDYKNLLTHGKNCWLAGDKEWTRMLEFAVSDKKSRTDLGAAARRFVELEFATKTYRPDLGDQLGTIIFGDSVARPRR